MPSGRGSRRRGRGKKKRRGERHLRVASESDPIMVHAPQDHGEVAFGSYITACTGLRVETPPNLVVRYDERGPYLVAGPHPRYYQQCPGCFSGVDW